MGLEKFYSCHEVAERYGVTVDTVWSWVRRGELPAIKIGKLYKIKESDLETFENAKKV